MPVKTQNQLTRAMQTCLHKHLRVPQQLQNRQQTPVDHFDRGIAQPLFGVVVYELVRLCAHLFLAVRDDLEARTQCLGRRLSYRYFCIPQCDPNMVHDAPHIRVEQVRHIPCHFLDDQYGRVSTILIPFTLQEVQRTLHLEFHKLVSQRVSSMLRHTAQHTRCSKHDLRIRARQVRLQILVEAIQTRTIVLALEPDKVVDGCNATQLACRLCAVCELYDAPVQLIRKRLEPLSLQLRQHI